MESIKRVILIGTLGILVSSLLLAFFAPTAEAADSQVKISIDNKSDYSITVSIAVLDSGDEVVWDASGVFDIGPGESRTVRDTTISEGTYDVGFYVDIHDESYSKYVECKSNKITNVDLVVYPNDAEIVVHSSEKDSGWILWVCGAIFIILIIVILLGVCTSRVRKRARGREAGEKREREAQEKTKRAEREEIIKQFKASYLDPECTKRVKFNWLIDTGSLIISKEIITFRGQKTELQFTSISNVTKESIATGGLSLVSFDARTKDGKLRKVSLGGTELFKRKWNQITDEIYHTLSEWQPK